MEEKMLASGDLIYDRYELVSELGEGGMSEVWKAFDLQQKDLVAVKIFKPEAAAEDEQAKRRFLQEAHVQIQVNHANVVSIIDVGLLPDNRPYLAMELLEGETLEQYLARRRRLSPAEARALLVPIASALTAVHQAGVIHRDLKPGNIMLVSLPGHSRVIIPKVLDFGIAKILHGDERKLTQTGRTFGTPDYMSPERLMGNPASPSDDIFSLGVIAYRLITGDAPFHADSVPVMIAQIISPNPPPRINEPGQPLFVPTVVEQTIMRALEKESKRRFTSMEEMLQALLQWPGAEGGMTASATRAQAAVPAPATPPPAPSQEPGRWTLKPGDINVDWTDLAKAKLADAKRKLTEGEHPERVLGDVGRPRSEPPSIQPGHDWLGKGDEDALPTEPRRRLSASQLAMEEPRLPLSPGTRHTLWLLALVIALVVLGVFSWQLLGDAIDYWQEAPVPAIEQPAAPASAPTPAPLPPPAPPDTKAARPHKTNRSPPAGRRQ